MAGLEERLFTQDTNFRNLKFGKDKPGGGSSKEPFVNRNTLPGLTEQSPDLGLLGGNSDFLLRAGTLKRTADDVSRITQFFTTGQGLQFIAKQNLLSRSGVQTQASGKVGLNEGVYLPTSTVAQLGVAGSGGHLNKQGINPFAQTGGAASLGLPFDLPDPVGLPQYLKVKQTGTDNRLLQLKETKISPSQDVSPTNNTRSFGQRLGNIISVATAAVANPASAARSVINSILGIPNQDEIILEYNGGPGSDYGVGKTRIRRYTTTLTNEFKNDYEFLLSREQIDQRADDQKNKKGQIVAVLDDDSDGNLKSKYKEDIEPGKNDNTNSVLEYNNTKFRKNNFLLSYEQIVERANNTRTRKGYIQRDFRSELLQQQKEPGAKKDILSSSPAGSDDFEQKKIETRVGLGDPGSSAGKDLTSYSKGSGKGPVDKVNALPLYQSAGVTADAKKNDLIKFRIAVYNPHDKNGKKTYIHFRAFIDSFQDNYASQWESFKYMGRSEEFYKYQGFTRNISLSWKLVAQSREELIIMYKKLNYLQSVMAGDYSQAGYMEGNVVNLTVGGYFWEQPGFFTSLNVTFPDKATYEIGIPDPEVKAEFNTPGQEIETRLDVKEVPHYLEVSAAFTPIHNFVPRKQQNIFKSNGDLETYGQEHFINLTSDGGPSKSSYGNITPQDKFTEYATGKTTNKSSQDQQITNVDTSYTQGIV